MSWWSIRTAFLSFSLVLACALLAPDASAQKGTKKQAGPNALIIHELHAAINLLKQADHDYKGHRVKAIHFIHVAIKDLETTKHKHPHPKVTPGGKLPQNVSDGLLNKAKGNLLTIQSALQATVNGPGQRAAAIQAIQTAITEINTALSIK